MTHRFAELTFTDSVKAAQKHYGSRERLQRFTTNAGPNDELTDREAGFIALRDTFYMATVNEDGWPYVQHRGGPLGFLRVLGPKQLAYADFRGNTQLISVGNVSSNDRVSVENAQSVPATDRSAVELPGYQAKIERVVYIDVAAFDWNCPQHITQRYTESELEQLQDSRRST